MTSILPTPWRDQPVAALAEFPAADSNDKSHRQWLLEMQRQQSKDWFHGFVSPEPQAPAVADPAVTPKTAPAMAWPLAASDAGLAQPVKDRLPLAQAPSSNGHPVKAAHPERSHEPLVSSSNESEDRRFNQAIPGGGTTSPLSEPQQDRPADLPQAEISTPSPVSPAMGGIHPAGLFRSPAAPWVVIPGPDAVTKGGLSPGPVALAALRGIESPKAPAASADDDDQKAAFRKAGPTPDAESFPVRIHVIQQGDQATIWLGVDASHQPELPVLTEFLANQLAQRGYANLNWICNGQPLNPVPDTRGPTGETEDRSSDFPSLTRGQAKPGIESSASNHTTHS